MPINVEKKRLAENKAGAKPWKFFGPYLAERQWGTVREDYSPNGTAWEYFPHEHARSRAYRWGEDGIAGFSDDLQRLCLSLALWNGKDPILKERLFGLTNARGQPRRGREGALLLPRCDADAFVPENALQVSAGGISLRAAGRGKCGARQRSDGEFELLDTGIFDEDRYWDVFVEYAKAAPDDILMRVTVHNRGPETATIHVLPHLWFRNTWSWEPIHRNRICARRGGSAIASRRGTRHF